MKTETLNDKYKPVPLNLKKEVARAMGRPGFKEAWDALEEEYTTLAALLEARKQSGLTQEQLAARMGTTKSAVSRLEASLRSDKGSPSFATLRKYAHRHLNLQGIARFHVQDRQAQLLGCRLDGLQPAAPGGQAPNALLRPLATVLFGAVVPVPVHSEAPPPAAVRTSRFTLPSARGLSDGWFNTSMVIGPG